MTCVYFYCFVEISLLSSVRSPIQYLVEIYQAKMHNFVYRYAIGWPLTMLQQIQNTVRYLHLHLITIQIERKLVIQHYNNLCDQCGMVVDQNETQIIFNNTKWFLPILYILLLLLPISSYRYIGQQKRLVRYLNCFYTVRNKLPKNL